MVRNIVQNNPNRKKSYIDICLMKDEEELLLRLRNNGPLYNPLESLRGDEDMCCDIETLSEIEIVRRLAKKTEYSRVIDLNNIIVVVDKEIGEINDKKD